MPTASTRKSKDHPKKIDRRTKEKLIIEYAPLIKFIAQKIAVRLPSNIEFDDLVSSGVIGLMDAIDKYDPTRDNKFKTYAEFRIRGAILDELRAQDWVPRSVREKAKQLERAHLRLEQKLGRVPTEEELTSELQISRDEYFELLNQVKSVSILSLDEAGSFNSSDRKSILSLLESCKIPSPLAQLSYKDVREVVTRAIESLPEKQRLVLSLYYYEDLNLKEIGDVLEVTESRVSQLHTQAILWLRRRLRAHFEREGTDF
jgi:RNA polymerase sigma factor for flagellar operon FliA